MEKDKLLYVSYDSLKEDPTFPKSLWQVFINLFKGILQEFKKNFPKSLIQPLIIIIILGLFNIFFLAVREDTYYLSHWRIDFIDNIKAYIMPGVIWSNSRFAGFSHLSHDKGTLSVVIPFMMIFMYLLSAFFQKLFSKEKFKGFFNDIKEMKNTKKTYMALANKQFSDYYIKGLLIAFIGGFIIKNPLTIFLLALMLLFSFIKNNKGNILIIIGTLKAAHNIKRNKEGFVNFGNIAITILGISYGLFTYFGLMVLIWFVFNYSIWARAIFSALFIALFIFLIISKIPKKQLVKAASFGIFFISFLLLNNRIGLADDGGWTESGSNIIDWLANAGTKIIAALGFTGSIAAAIGWATNMVIGNVAGYFNVGPLLQLGGLVAGFGEPSGSMAANLTFSQAALKAAFGSMGPLGDMLSNTVGGINDALSGGTGGSSESSGSSIGSDSSAGNSDGGIKDLGDEYGKKKHSDDF